MDLELLRSLQAVAQEQNLTAAAEKLYVTQPTLTRRLDNLEQECGRKLLIRGKRKTTLTEEGKLMLKYADNILGLYDRMEEDIFHFDDLISGELIIGTVNSSAFDYIAKVIRIIRERYPMIRFFVRTMAAKELEDGITNGRIDYGLLYETIDANLFDSVTLPVTNKWGLVMRKDAELANLEYLTAKDLKSVPLITPEIELTRSILAGWGGINPDKLNIIVNYYLTNSVGALAHEGIGYGLVMDSTLPLMQSYDLKFIPLKPVLSANVHVIWNKHLELSRIERIFLDELRNIVEQGN